MNTIRAAVWTACVFPLVLPPAMAAEVTISGEFEYFMQHLELDLEDFDSEFILDDFDSRTSFVGGDQIIRVSATSETAFGFVISAEMNVLVDNDQEVETDGGEHVTVSGPFGSLSVGDVSGALDYVGDYTDVVPQGIGFGADGSDASVLYVLPEFVPGVSVAVSHTPRAGDGAENFGNTFGGESLSMAYTVGSGAVYYGVEDLSYVATTAFGVRYAFGALMVAAESGRLDFEGLDSYDVFGLAATYKAGDTTLILESQDNDQGIDTRSVALTHQLGGGLQGYVQMTRLNFSAPVDYFIPSYTLNSTFIGLKYEF